MSWKQLQIAAMGLLVAIGLESGLHAQTAATPNAVLVELFTSEGCSSCPPADALLQKLNGQVTSSGQTVIALSEHVTYWNQEGWTDPFSQQSFTDRQKRYGDRFGVDDVYTPQMVINGDQQVNGSDGAAILKALAAEAKTPTANVKIVSIAAEDKMLSVTFALSGDLPRQGADVIAAVAENQVTSNVGRGENGGRTLTHVAVVRTLTKVATLKGATTMTAKVSLGKAPAGVPLHLVVFVQAVGFGKVLSVATIPIAPGQSQSIVDISSAQALH